MLRAHGSSLQQTAETRRVKGARAFRRSGRLADAYSSFFSLAAWIAAIVGALIVTLIFNALFNRRRRV